MAGKRLDLFKHILLLDKPLSILEKEVSKLSWWDDSPIVVLKVDDLKRIIALYENGQLSIVDLIRWFNLIELRDEIEYGHSEQEHDIIAGIITYFANLDAMNFDRNDMQMHMKNLDK
jgi:hypothetical protein